VVSLGVDAFKALVNRGAGFVHFMPTVRGP
jgi:hypothetical protein